VSLAKREHQKRRDELRDKEGKRACVCEVKVNIVDKKIVDSPFTIESEKSRNFLKSLKNRRHLPLSSYSEQLKSKSKCEIIHNVLYYQLKERRKKQKEKACEWEREMEREKERVCVNEKERNHWRLVLEDTEKFILVKKQFRMRIFCVWPPLILSTDLHHPPLPLTSMVKPIWIIVFMQGANPIKCVSS